jgi:ABC-type molybdate transport system substrate-binding protein
MLASRLASAVVVLLCVVGCATTQSGFRPLGKTYPAKPADAAVEVFESGEPTRAFERIARLDTHFEKTHLMYTAHAAAIQELQKQARAAGADAIIEVREMRSRVGETFILHVTGIAIRYSAP